MDEELINIFIELIGAENTNKIIDYFNDKKLVPIDIIEQPKWNDRNRYIIQCVDIRKQVYMTYNPIYDDLRCGIYTKDQSNIHH